MDSGNQKILVLPKLKADSDVRASDKPGEWDIQSEKAFQNVANSLDYQAPGAVKSISSVPTMWARPLLMEMALYNQAHPLHQQVVEQWQGMLAAIALAEVRGFDLKAQLVELETLKTEDFADSLFWLKPQEKNTLYKLAQKNAWQDVYVFLWNGKPVGMSSPSTLVVPSEEGEWNRLPWWKQQDGIWKLSSPQTYLNDIEQALLWRWLENLDNELTNHQGITYAINIMRGLIGDFQASLKRDETQELSLSNDHQFFGVPLNRGVLAALNRPVKRPDITSSDVRLIASSQKEAKPLLIIDPEISNQWNIPAQQIGVHRDKTLAALRIQDLPNLRITWQDVILIQSDELFLKEFIFIDQEQALPGVLLPNTSTPLIFNNQRITPLIPLNPILLDYFTPEDLIEKVKFEVKNNEVRVIVDLPLSGNRQPFRIQKDYPLKEENALTQVPVLEVWPNLRTPGWKEYYGFYYDAAYGNQTFQVSFPGAKDDNIFQENQGSYQIVRMEEFPNYIKCFDTQRKLIGLITLATPQETRLTGDWKVGVDFGTSFTNIYVGVSRDIIPKALQLENLILKITDTQIETRRPVLFEYFIPESFIPEDKPLPLPSVLTTRGSKKTITNTNQNLILDGRIYTPRNSDFKPQETWIKTNLKWSDNRVFSELFLKHLILHISALAAAKNIKRIQWCISYPSAFSRSQYRDYLNQWQDLTETLQNTTGIEQSCPDSIDHEDFKTESLATAQYFRDQERHNLVKAICIDIGGGTSDISIWETPRKLVHQCSIQLAGRDLFSQFLEINPQFVEDIFEMNSSGLTGLKAGAFNAKLDVWLRQSGDDWLNNKKRFVLNKPKFKGFIRLMTIGMAGLYYYMGILLKVLHSEEEQKYIPEEITEVYIGGNGSRLLHWLGQGNQFSRDDDVNDIFSWMLSKASEFQDDEITTRLSRNPKDEVACGLVLDDTQLTQKNENEQQKRTRREKQRTEDHLIAGEGCYVNGDFIDAEARLKKFESDDKLTEFRIPELKNLSQFLYEFHIALNDLDIEDIEPLPGYVRKPEVVSNRSLWSKVEDQLTDSLQKFRGKNFKDIRLEPPFILGLKALLKVLAKQWADK